MVSVPDLNTDTQGSGVAEAIAMARDAIAIWGITEQDLGRDIPQPGNLKIELNVLTMNFLRLLTLILTNTAKCMIIVP